ncbi:TBC1 domain family member 2 [Nematocida sp. LUAm3]|nr:TBC1 domain family member 2 [Nematocida sp. LUAm3]KAI5175529.1 TBC1 domain family member 2 [Nematocida sp. LUAm2]KAI5178441.1 TBC1 domain family member 2 [Nematocida sp. LUAm1]
MLSESEGIKELRENAWFGLKEKERSRSWLVLLDIIGPLPEEHGKQIKARRDMYDDSIKGLNTPISSPEILSPSSGHNKQLKQIEKDINRMEIESKEIKERYTRAMLVFSRKYLVIGYVQGMCDIFNVFYEVHSSVWSPDDSEMLSYFCFSRVTGQALDCFGTRQSGIERSIEEIEELIRIHVPDVYRHFRSIGLEIKYFAYNWMSTFMFREFSYHKKIMDAHFSLGISSFLRFNVSFSVSVIFFLKNQILLKDFEKSILFLQNLSNYPWKNEDLNYLLSLAYIIYSKQPLPH